MELSVVHPTEFQANIWNHKLIDTECHIYASLNYASLVQIMACGLVSTKPLSEPLQEYC